MSNLPRCLVALTVAVAGCGELADAPSADGTEASGGKADSAGDPPGCVFDDSDPFEPRERIPTGPNKGRCYDTRQIRPVVRLDAAEAALYGGPGVDELVLANVFHDGTFWVAHVPRSDVENVVFQLEYFPAIVPAGHTQMRIRFRADAPVRLFGQTVENAGETHTLRDLVLSVEAVGQPGYRYDIVRGVLDNFGTAYRVTSLAAKLDHMVVQNNRTVEQWELATTPDERRRLVETYAQDSETRGMQTMYNTLFVNCTNEAIRILDLSIVYNLGEQIARFLAKVTEFYPNIVRTALIARGLVPLDGSSDWPLLADDPTVAGLLAELRGH